MDQSIENIEVLLSSITDPEIPVLSIVEMGILNKVEWQEDQLIIEICPTYSGCPAMDMITQQIKALCHANGLSKVEVIEVLDPAWTTDRMSTAAKEKLEAYGIAPPQGKSEGDGIGQPKRCPQCKSVDLEKISDFGSTACKALWRCKSCLEPFDYFKCH